VPATACTAVRDSPTGTHRPAVGITAATLNR
jgi:hypothetical protein